MRLIVLTLLYPMILIKAYSQAKSISSPNELLRKQYKIALINPGLEVEIPQFKNTTVNIHFGVGYGGSYPNLTTGFESGVQHLISPFADVQYRFYYSGKRRLRKNKYVNNNTGSFIVCRGLVRGQGFSSSFIRTSDIDFALGIGWGFQRYKRRFGWSFSIMPYYYFDDIGNAGFLPFFPEINVGYVLSKNK